MNETILIILLALGIGNQIERQKPKEMLFQMSDGSIIETVIDNNSTYYCPQYCSAEHKHYSHYKNSNCNMKNKCYHFVHSNQINITSIIDEIETNITSTEIIINKTPEIITASLDKKND